jgi:hypothetical protein
VCLGGETALSLVLVWSRIETDADVNKERKLGVAQRVGLTFAVKTKKI